MNGIIFPTAEAVGYVISSLRDSPGCTWEARLLHHTLQETSLLGGDFHESQITSHKSRFSLRGDLKSVESPVSSH